LGCWTRTERLRRGARRRPGRGARCGCRFPARAARGRLRAARLAWVGARGGLVRRGLGNAAGGAKLVTAVLAGTGRRLGPGRPATRPATKARWGYASAQRAAGGTFKAADAPFFPPCSRTARGARALGARGLGARGLRERGLGARGLGRRATVRCGRRARHAPVRRRAAAGAGCIFPCWPSSV
jgi:hypothetical protein